MADIKEFNINNTTYDIKAKSVVDTNNGKLKFWSGTRQEYDAIVTKDPYTLYNVTGAETDADQIITELANKTNINFDNVTDEAKVLMSSMGMPSDSYVALALGASGATYTAPADGYFALVYNTTATFCYCHMRIKSGATLGDTKFYNQSGLNGMMQYICASKGDTLVIAYGGLQFTEFTFHYANGSESEAN